MSDKFDCDKCIATKQMQESHHCTKTVIKEGNSLIPECLITIRHANQMERNYLTCPTYNLGIYEACSTCPLECIKNTSRTERPTNAFSNFIDMFGTLFNVDDVKKTEINQAFDQLNKPEFKNIYNSIQRSSTALQDVMNNNTSNHDVNSAILKAETQYLKSELNNLVKDGKISQDEVRMAQTELETLTNMQKLKTLIKNIKK